MVSAPEVCQLVGQQGGPPPPAEPVGELQGKKNAWAAESGPEHRRDHASHQKHARHSAHSNSPRKAISGHLPCGRRQFGATKQSMERSTAHNRQSDDGNRSRHPNAARNNLPGKIRGHGADVKSVWRDRHRRNQRNLCRRGPGNWARLGFQMGA
jgi:hypothetical protein